MTSFIREKKIFCENRKKDKYREVDLFTYTAAQKRAVSRPKRSKKIKVSEPKQKNLNEKNGRRYFTQVAMMNYGDDPKALHVSLTYKDKYLPASVEEAEREIRNYLNRINYERKKQGLPPVKYMLVTAYSMRKDSGKPTRIHHHIIMDGGLDRDMVEELWRKRRKKGEKAGDKIGFCNADRLQPDENGIAALCHYLIKQAGGKKRWSTSHNLDRPMSQTTDGKFTQRQIRKWVKERPGKEFWERKYPGWTLLNEEHGIEYVYNDQTGWAIYLKLKKRE